MRRELTQFHCDPPDLHRLRRLSSATGRPMSSYVREGLKLVLEKYDPPRPKEQRTIGGVP